MAAPLPETYANRAYPKRMGAHGRPVEIPKWWIDLLTAAMKAKGIDRAQLGRMLIDAGMIDSATAEKKATAARVAVHRFFGGKPTAEIAELWRVRLDLPRFEFIAASRKHSEAMLLAERDPDALSRMMAAGSLMMSLESGEHSLDEILGRQTGSVDSPDGAVRRGSRGAGAVPKAARSERR